ncbi:MAG: hypothetical protein J6A59_11590 [Lachnospiraceae bacterium]|nr:hypothetical protein [Lachnospiraceae bacterium]
MGILKVLKTTGLVGAGFALGVGFAYGVQAFLDSDDSKKPDNEFDFDDKEFDNSGFGTPGFGAYGFRTTGFGTPGFGASGFGAPGFGAYGQMYTPTPEEINETNRKFKETLSKGVNTNNSKEANVNPVLK